MCRMQTLTEAVNAIYLLADKPDILCGDLLKAVSSSVFKTDNQPWNTAGLAKLLFLAGQICIQHNLHLDSIERHWKRQRSTQSTDQLAQTTATLEDDFADTVRHVKESELLFGEKSILRVFGQMAAFIAVNNLAFADDHLQRIASLSLGKMMSVSSKFCEQHLQLFLTIMERSPDAVIRGNMVIAFGDICQSYSRLLDPHLPHLFARLHDQDGVVRRTSLMVICHLTLSGMIKVRGAFIGDIAMCVDEQEDQHICDLAKMFFAELAGKDANNSIIYNHLPDIITSLTANCQQDGDQPARILRYLMTFIKKDRQLESLVEKLTLRFRQTDLSMQRSVAKCLLALPINTDKCIIKLIDGLPYYQDKLCDGEMANIFMELANKIKKGVSREDLRETIGVWEQKLGTFMDVDNVR